MEEGPGIARSGNRRHGAKEVLFMRQTKMLHIFEMLLLCGLGLTLILAPGKSLRTAMIILGIALMVCGVVAAGYYFFVLRNRPDPERNGILICVLGCVGLILGLIIIIVPSLLKGLFRAAAGVLVAFSGILNLVKALDVKKEEEEAKEKRKEWPFLLALSLVAIALGVLIFINPFKSESTLVILVGAVLIYNGVLGIFTAIQDR